MEELSVYNGMRVGANIGVDIEGGGESGVCFGGGAHADTMDVSGSLGAHTVHDHMNTVSDSDASFTHQTSVTWSYSTSGEPEYAGKDSDSFLLNTLAVIFRETRTILFNETTCTASEESPRRVTFDVGSQDNRKPLSFVSYFQVKNAIQPQLDRVLASKMAERNGELSEVDSPIPSDADSPAPSPDQLQSQISILEAGANAWRSILADYEDTHAKARNKTLPQARDFFNVRKAREPACQRRKYTIPVDPTMMSVWKHKANAVGLGISEVLPMLGQDRSDSAGKSIKFCLVTSAE